MEYTECFLSYGKQLTKIMHSIDFEIKHSYVLEVHKVPKTLACSGHHMGEK